MILLAILVLFFVLFLVLNLKVLPGAWHIRVLHGIYAQTHAPRPKNDKKKPVFKYLVTSTRATPFECDYNGHKSNSTYFSDLDINRTQLLARLFKPVLSASHYDRSKRKRHLNIALGSTCCVFRREIRPLQEVEIWSRVVSWDEKWVYLASYFVRGQSSSCSKGEGSKPQEEDTLASGIARYVFKDGRRTVQPVEAMENCGMLPSYNEPDWEEYEAERVKGMQMGRLLAGLERLPVIFCPDNAGQI